MDQPNRAQLLPASPLVTSADKHELALLRLTRGGFDTAEGTVVHDQFEVLADKGWLKIAAITDGRTYWRLCGDGLKLAYSGGGA